MIQIITMLLRVTKYGEPILRQKGEPVTVFDDSLKQLFNDMVETMHAEEGVGIAAQQVDRALMFCVVDVSLLPDEEIDYQLDGLRQPIELVMPLGLVNPVIKPLPGRKIVAEEGCLSFPGIRGDVPREERVQVTFQDLDGKPHSLVCGGWFARVVQHEVDHLNGQLFIDHMDKRKLRLIEGRLRKLKRETRRLQ